MLVSECSEMQEYRRLSKAAQPACSSPGFEELVSIPDSCAGGLAFGLQQSCGVDIEAVMLVCCLWITAVLVMLMKLNVQCLDSIATIGLAWGG